MMARSAGTQTRSKSGFDLAPCGTAEEIARVAYELFQQRGGQHGSDQQDWFEAERIVAQRRQAAKSRRNI
jgi:hypothetical protein